MFGSCMLGQEWQRNIIENMPSSSAKLLRWLWWTLFVVFTVIAMVIQVKLLPRGHWGRHILYPAAMLLAQLCTAFILRRLGLSQEARHIEKWPNQNRGEMASTDFAYELRYSQWNGRIFVPLSVLAVLFMLGIYLFVPPGQVIGRELALPLIGVLVFMGVFLWYCFSQPVMRVDSRGISGAFNELMPWSEITECGSEERHNAQGDLAHHSIYVLGRMSNRIAVYDISGTPEEERLRFCKALRHVLTKD